MRKLTDEAREDILNRMASGQSLRSACAAHNIVASAVIKACSKDADFGEQYARAKDEGIDAQAEEMHDLEMQVLSGQLDPNAFRAAMDARKWRLARQSPRKYGDSQRIEQTTKLSADVSVSHTISPETAAAVSWLFDPEPSE